MTLWMSHPAGWLFFCSSHVFLSPSLARNDLHVCLLWATFIWVIQQPSTHNHITANLELESQGVNIMLLSWWEWGGGPYSATGFQENLTFASVSKPNSLIIPRVLQFFIKEKIQANKLLCIYTSYSVTISRIWLILYKLYYCTSRNNLFCFKLILATLDCSSICCRKKKRMKLFAHSYCEFSSPRYVFKNYISQKTT